MRRKNRTLALTTLCLAAGLVAAGCDSSLPPLDSPSDWDQREQDRNDADELIDDITGNPKGWANGSTSVSGVGAPPASLGREAEPAVWSAAAQAYVSAGVTTRNGADWDWTFLLRILDGNGDPQQTPDGNTERIQAVLTADGARTTARDGRVTEQTMSWLVLGEITGIGSGTLDVSVNGTLDSQSVTDGVVSDIPGSFRADVSVAADTDDCPSGGITARLGEFSLLGTVDAVNAVTSWEAYTGDIEEGEEPFETASLPLVCEAAP